MARTIVVLRPSPTQAHPPPVSYFNDITLEGYTQQRDHLNLSSTAIRGLMRDQNTEELRRLTSVHLYAELATLMKTWRDAEDDSEYLSSLELALRHTDKPAETLDDAISAQAQD
eukprot:1816352-Amphidinium_carterae.1